MFLAVGLFAVLSACSGKHPTAPSPGPTIACPADMHVEAASGQTAFPVSYPNPTIMGGKPPVSETCTPPSGQPFDLGTTTVSCHGVDADAREAVCTFAVIVQPPAPQLSLTRFMAFGDSLTEGKVSMIPELTLPASYTLKLTDMLRGRYYDQQIDVINEGLGGRKAVEDIDRFDQALDATHPQAVLLMEGTNDLGELVDDNVDPVRDALETMALHATTRGLPVFLATLPPQKPPASKGSLVPELNGKIVTIAKLRHFNLVDVYGAFHGDLTLIGSDGVHPTDAGHAVIAQAFFDQITARLQVPDARATASVMRIRP
jgi:acyl-CoA thioesterase I